jgi:N-acetylglucosaminyldiphosphoundecaprenol N-acetyl-beta-D-mannosaminyltransferase
MSGLLDRFPTVRLLGLDLVAAKLPDVAATLSSRPVAERFGYVVTPNADHFVRLHDRGESATDLYRAAGSLLLDSRVVHGIARMLRLPVPPVVTGSDLTATLLGRWIDPNEPITIVGTTREAVSCLRGKYKLSNVAHHCPPFGFEKSQNLIEECAAYVEDHPARFVLFACGAPRQEILAHRIFQRGRATGIGLCIGSALDQLGGLEKRAPAWMRHHGLEWLWRVLRSPSRMAGRYLADVRIFALLVAEARRPRAGLNTAGDGSISARGPAMAGPD